MSSTGVSAGAEPLRIITGPTGAGKSALALQAAERLGATIVSADSRQIYRGFDIGTAKPTGAERARVRHEGIDVADPEERWSAARWAAAAATWIAEERARGRPVLLVGGTGLWLRALVTPLADEPAMDPARRTALQQELALVATAELRRRVEQLDPSRAHLGRTQLLRAAEVALLTGTRISDWHARGKGKPARRARWLVVDPGAALQWRLAARVDAMFDAGWEQEVRALTARVPSDAPAWNACGYQAIRDLVQGKRDRALVREQVLVRTRQYAKRQRTWFRNQLDDELAVRRLDPGDPAATRRAVDWLFEGVDA
ncbi:MAG: tRNA (adenosine(37)-N6)-dimethylallyltransferase MiaA [Gemmatimonadota bacterium]|nr:tRNA (adenosine(37)-N6)-dimethylallyltransferase MiaA [Gemmatimonadota bacterium]